MQKETADLLKWLPFAAYMCCVICIRCIMMNRIKNMKSWLLCLATMPSKSPVAGMKVCDANKTTFTAILQN